MKNEYTKQADDFLKKTDTTMATKFNGYKNHSKGDKEKRDVYTIVFSRNNRSFTLEFGQSLNNSGYKLLHKDGSLFRKIPTNAVTKDSKYIRHEIARLIGFALAQGEKITSPKEPTTYDVLACLQKYDVGTMEDFCSEFGYNEDSIVAMNTYKAVIKEFGNVQKLWTDIEIEDMQEIQ